MTNDTDSYPARGHRGTLWCLIALLAALSTDAHAQADVRIFVDSTAQVVRGFGAANIVGWRPDMTDEEIETAFGIGDGQLGFSLLRLRIAPQEEQWAANVRTAKLAHEMGAKIVASPWSPPAYMKTNNDLVGGRLRDDMYDDYAQHLQSFNTFMADNGVPLYAVSVQNEPDIEVSYESCDWSPQEMRRFMDENAGSISTRVMAPESFQFRRAMSDPILRDASAAANLDIVAGHIYGGGLAPYPLAKDKGKELWMTEHLTLDTDLAANIGTAAEIQHAMKAGMNAYIWWYIVRFYGPISDGETPDYEKGEITKRGYAMSQFSRFVRPGYVRVHAEDSGAPSGVSVTAYRDTTSLAVVAVNTSPSASEVRFTIDGGSIGQPRRYVTSATHNAERLDDVETNGTRFTVTLDAHSVTTFTSDYAALSHDERTGPPRSYRLVQNYPNPFQSVTSIGYAVPHATAVTLEVLDVLGRTVATLVDTNVSAGSYEATFDASHLPAGMYIYRLKAGEVVQTRRMMLVD